MTPEAPAAPARSIAWRRILIESVAIVMSILLAFAIDAWWDEHQDRDREAALLEGLARDFEDSRPELEARVRLARRLARNNEMFVELLSAVPSPDPLVVPDSLVLAVIGGPTYEAAADALETAVASGEIELIRSRELRAELASWRRQIVDTREDEVEVRRITNEEVVPALATSVPLGPYFARLLAWSTDGASGGTGHVALHPSTRLAGVLALRRFYAGFASDDLGALLETLDRILVLLEAERRGSPRDAPPG